jgi:hypothetical protein
MLAARQVTGQLYIREPHLSHTAHLEPMGLEQSTHRGTPVCMRRVDPEPTVGAFSAGGLDIGELDGLLIETH